MSGLRALAAALTLSCTGEIRLPRVSAAAPSDPAADPGGAPAACPASPAVGRTPLHRLSNLEYDRSVRALVGDDSRPSRRFPPDSAAAGFDHVTDVQSVSALHAARYAEAAEALYDGLWARELDVGFERRYPPGQGVADGGLDQLMGLGWGAQYPNAPRAFSHHYRLYLLTTFDVAGPYEIGFEGAPPATAATLPDGGARPAAWQLHLDNQQPFYTAPVSGTTAQPVLHRATLDIEVPGVHRIDLSVSDPLDAPNCASGQPAGPFCEPFDPVLGHVGTVWVSRRSTRTAGAAAVRRCELEDSEACVRDTTRGLLRRAFRRPPAAEELERFMALWSAARAAGDSSRDAFGQVVAAVLLSPHFLFHVQLDLDPKAGPHPLSPHELATRLAYFLTRGPPDDELSALADDGSLTLPSVLEAQAMRLYTSREAEVMVDALSSQLLSTRDLPRAAPAAALFPSFDEPLRGAMASEATLLFRAVFDEPRPMAELASARFTFVDDALAAHYGLSLPGSAAPVRVALTRPDRGGVLGLASVLTVTSTATRPSPVKRGAWVLEHLLCEELPAPPPSVPALPETPDGGAAEALTAHTANPACRACHAVIDPLGLALERFDADGSRRAVDRAGRPLPARGTLPGGAEVIDLEGLSAHLVSSGKLEACLAQHLFTFALARVPSAADRCAAQALPAAAGPAPTFEQVTRALVGSETFRWRAPELEAQP